MSPTVWKFFSGKAEISVPIRTRLAVNTAETAVDAAVAGLGVTRVLSYQIAGALRARTLKIILGDFEPEPTPVNLVYAGQGLLPLKTRVFVDFAKERLQQNLGRGNRPTPDRIVCSQGPISGAANTFLHLNYETRLGCQRVHSGR